MTIEEFRLLPFLMREGQVARALGVSRYYVRKLRCSGLLTAVNNEKGRMKYLKSEVGRLAGLWH
jgi:predicted site-specific integrase-resolvase